MEGKSLGQIAREAYELHVGNVGESFEAAAAAVVAAHEERKANTARAQCEYDDLRSIE